MAILTSLLRALGIYAPPRDEIIHWCLMLRCADGMPESQGYDTEEEAEEQGQKQQASDPFVVDYKVYPWAIVSGRPGWALWGLVRIPYKTAGCT